LRFDEFTIFGGCPTYRLGTQIANASRTLGRASTLLIASFKRQRALRPCLRAHYASARSTVAGSGVDHRRPRRAGGEAPQVLEYAQNIVAT
jgi:hypothetical protein